MSAAAGCTWRPQLCSRACLEKPPPLLCPSRHSLCSQVHVLMGHGGGAAVGGGMTSKQQQAAMEAFRQQGRQLLVATAAGEEGIDVPCCELVVRFAATQTGEMGWWMIRLVQADWVWQATASLPAINSPMMPWSSLCCAYCRFVQPPQSPSSLLNLCAGRERLQSAGRARKHGSRFVEIIGATASELALVHKSRREEEHLRTALQGLAL